MASRFIPNAASDSTQVALVLAAKIGGNSVDVTAEYGASPPGSQGKGSWKLGWNWELGSTTLAQAAKTVWPELELPKDVGDIPLESIHAEFLSGAFTRAISCGIGGLTFIYVKEQSEAATATCWGLVYEKPIRIPTTGLIEALLGKDVELSELRVGSVSNAFAEQARTEVIGQFSPANLLLGNAGATGFVAGVTIQGKGVGAAPISLPFEIAAPKPATPPGTAVAPAPPSAGGNASASAAVDTTDGMRKWFPVDRSIGPLRIARLGGEWRDGKIGFLLDAAIETSALRLGLIGLAIRLPPSDLKLKNLEVGLDGIDVSYRGGAIAISGGLLKSEFKVGGQAVVQYDGSVLIKAAGLSMVGLGSYAALNGQPSLFVFAVLQKELGGPVFFRVNGLALGFGYNRRLKLPPIEDVANFPLVRAAFDPNYFAPVGAEDPFQAAMRRLHAYIPPAIGESWFSVGIRFNSFELIQSFAMLSVSFGSDLVISILGISTLTVPSRLAANVSPLCYAELALRAEFNPAAGVVSVEARLTSNSYVFEKACKLTGGFAFYTWMKGEHEGDFVVTLGGYHPRFRPPAHYPVVPRLGVAWVVSREARITGELYFALTPSCLMAGGKLAAIYDKGWLKAWFTAYADFLVAWKPFHYDIAIGVCIGASATVSINLLFGTISKTFEFELGADLHLWGPPFAGTARVKFYIVSFTVQFGTPLAGLPSPVQWKEFSESFLPRPESVCSVGFTGGLLREWERPDGTSVAIVNGYEFGVSVQSQAPCTAIYCNGKGEAESGSTRWEKQLGVAPMYASDLDATLRVQVQTRDGHPMPAELFTASVVAKGFPDALWGQGRPSLATPTSRVLQQVPAGISIVLSDSAKQSQIRHSLPAMKLERFEHGCIFKRIPWFEISLPKDIDAAPEATHLSKTLWNDAAVTDRRAAVLAALARVTPHALNEVALPETAARAATILQAEPTFAALGQLLPEDKR